MEQIIDGKVLFETYHSIAEYAQLAVANHHPDTPISQHTLNLVRDGWSEDIAQTLEVASSAVEASYELAEHANFAPHWDVTGAEVDVARYLSGEPECMIDFPVQETLSFGRTVTLVSSMDANCGMDGGGYLERGRVAVALSLALSRLGYSVELWADNFGADSPYPTNARAVVYQRMLVKGTNDTLDPAHLMYAFGHRTMLTELAFGTFDAFPAIWGATHSGGPRGCAWDERPEFVKDVYPAGTIYITGVPDGLDNAQAMAKYVMNEIRQLGLLAE